MRTFRLVAPALLLLCAACKPPEAAPSTPKPADAPPDGKQLMGGNPTAAEQPRGGGPTQFENAAKVEFTWDAAHNTVVAHLKLEPGFHAYGPGETTGKPVSIEVKSTVWTVKEVSMPPAQKKDLGELGTSFVFLGDVEIKAALTPGADAKAPVGGRLNYQVCSETSCDRPRSAAFLLTPG